MTDSTELDILIIGGGMVGASLACALQSLPLRIGLVEAVPLRSRSQPSYDDRSIALAYGTRRIFEGIRLWDTIADTVTAIRKIHVSDRGHFGMTHMDCMQNGYDALGYVVENRAMGTVFADTLPTLDNVELHCPAQLRALTLSKAGATADIESEQGSRTITARLIIAADGSQSMVRDLCNISTRERDYGQSAIIANVTPDRPHQNVAYERFTENGPLALLPMSDHRCSLVWTLRKHQAEAFMQLPDGHFLGHLQRYFGARLGRFVRIGRRHCYPLKLIRARHHDLPRLALIGNAAHTLHPIAGQGFNLGLRDVAALAQVINEAVIQQRDIGATRTLRQYNEWRLRDQRNVALLTDNLVKIFSNNFPPLVLARNAGLLALDLLPPLKKTLMRQTMGLAGRLPRLARGLPL